MKKLFLPEIRIKHGQKTRQTGRPLGIGPIFGVIVAVLIFSCSGKTKKTAPGTKTAVATKTKIKNVKNTKKPVKNTEIVLWHSYRGLEKNALEQVTKQFNNLHNGVRVKLLQVPYDAFVDKVQITTPRGQGPDLFIFAHNMIGEWVDDTPILEPLTNLIPRTELDKFLPKTIESLIYKGNIYGLPLAFKSVALFYNKAMVKTPPATFDQMVHAAQAVTKPDKGIWGLVYEAGLFYFNAAWFNGLGASVLGTDNMPRLDTPQAIKAMLLIKSLVKQYKITPSGVTSAMVTSLFNQGKAAMVINGPWFLAELNPKIKYGVTLMPKLAYGGLAKPYLGTEAVYLSKYSKKKQAAIKFMLFLTSDKAAKTRLNKGRQMVANKSVYTNELFQKNPVAKTFWVEAKTSVIMPKQPDMQLIWPVMDMAISKSVFGDIDAKKALKEAQAKVMADLRNKAEVKK